MSYGNVYVASVAMGAKDEHTLKAFLEAEAYPGPSLIIAYSHCIAHGINMTTAMSDQKGAVESGQWLLTDIIPIARMRARIRCSWTPELPPKKYKTFYRPKHASRCLPKASRRMPRNYGHKPNTMRKRVTASTNTWRAESQKRKRLTNVGGASLILLRAAV